MQSVKGNNINLYKYDSDTEEDILIACARDCTFNLDVKEKIVTSVGSQWFEESRPDVANWNIDISGLIILQDYSYLYLLNMQLNRETNTFKFVIDNGTIGGLVIVSGTAWLKGLRLSAPTKEMGTYQCSLKGTGGYSLAGTQITPGGYVITGTTISVLQWAASGSETSHIFTDGIGRTMLYGSRGGSAMAPLTYLGTNPTEANAADWTIATGTLKVPTAQPFFAGENQIILVQ